MYAYKQGMLNPGKRKTETVGKNSVSGILQELHSIVALDTISGRIVNEMNSILPIIAIFYLNLFIC